MLTANDVANFFIETSLPEDKLTNLKLQKMLYYAQAWSLVLFDEPLFQDNLIAFDKGPVVRKVWKEHTHNYDSVFQPTGKIDYSIFSNEQVDMLTDLMNVYSKTDPWTMVMTTHAKGSPWSLIYDKHPGSGKIPIEQIKQYHLQRNDVLQFRFHDEV